MKIAFLISVLLQSLATTAGAAWFQVQGKDFSRIEMLGNKKIILYRPLNQSGNSLPAIYVSSFYPTGSQGEAANIDQIELTPPPGVESQFLSILLSDLATKGTLMIEGHIATNSSVITSTRVQIQ